MATLCSEPIAASNAIITRSLVRVEEGTLKKPAESKRADWNCRGEMSAAAIETREGQGDCTEWGKRQRAQRFTKTKMKMEE